MRDIVKNEEYFQVERTNVREELNTTGEIISIKDIAVKINDTINIPKNECVVTFLIRWLLEKIGCDLVMPGEKYYVLTSNSEFYHLRVLTGMELKNSSILSGSEFYENFVYTPVAKGLVFYDKNGNNLWEPIKSNYKFEAWVELDEQTKVVNETLVYKGRTFEKAEMPKIVKSVDGFEKVVYQQYDHEIAVATLLFNRHLDYAQTKLINNIIYPVHNDKVFKFVFEKDGPDRFLVGNSAFTNLPSKLDSTLVKSIIMKETVMGTGSNLEHAKKDIMQVNNGVKGTDGKTDWIEAKCKLNLKKDVLPTPFESVKAGVYWLAFKNSKCIEKGIKGLSYIDNHWDYTNNIKFENIVDKIEKNVAAFYYYTWDKTWDRGIKNYNGGGVKNYYNLIMKIYESARMPKISDYYCDDKDGNFIKP